MSDKLANALAGDDQLPEEYWRRFEEPPAVTTADALAYRDPYEQEVAEHQRNLLAAQDREGYDALTRLVTTLLMPMAAAHRASGHLPKAISRHIAQERKEGNSLVGNPWLPLWLGNTGVQQGLGAYELMAGQPGVGLAGAGLNALVNAYLSKNHIVSTHRILQHLNRTEPKTKTVY